MIDFVAIASFSVIVPLLVGLMLYKRLLGAGRWLTWLMAAWLLAETVAYLLRMRDISNWNVYVLLSLVQIVIITYLYRSMFIEHKAKEVCSWLGWIGIVIIIVEYALASGPVNTIGSLYECAFYFGMGLYSVFELITFKRTTDRYNLINIAMMLFFLGSAVYLASWNWMKFDREKFILYGNAHAYLMMICYSIFTYSLWKLQS